MEYEVDAEMSRIRNQGMKAVVSALLMLITVIIPRFAECADLSATRKAAPTIRVVMDNNYPPFVFQDGEGRLRGILVDEWRLWERKTGVRVELHGMDWGEALRRMRAGEFDVIDSIFRTEERAGVFDFTKPYTSIDVPIYFNKEIAGISDADSLRDFTVAVKVGDAAIEFLRRHGVERFREFRSYEDIVRSALRHEVDVFVVDEPSALYFLYKMGGVDRFRRSPSLYSGLLHRAVRKGNISLLRLVESGFAAISPAEKKAVEEKWSGKGVMPPYLIRYLLFPGAFLSILFALLWVWNRSLRKAVVERTAELSREVELGNLRAEALKKSEQKFQAIFNSVNDAIFIHDPETGAIVDVNATMTSMYGYTRDEAISLTVGVISSGFSPYTDEYALARIRKAEGGEKQIFEWHARRKDGGLFWAEVNMREALIGDRRRVVVAVRDITDRKLAEADLGRLEEQLQHSQKMEVIGRLAGCMAHDFNNILTVIIGHGNLLLTKIGGENPLRAQVEHILSSSKRAAKLIKGLLTFSRKQVIKPVQMDLNRTVGNLREFMEWIVGKDIEIRIESDTRELLVMGDSGQMEQVLMNLVVNARDAMPHGGVLDIRTCLVEGDRKPTDPAHSAEPPRYACITVSDNGLGMDGTTLERLFEPFFTTKEIGKGTGLGLSIVNGIIERHNGFIDVESEEGKGTTFRIRLPLVSCKFDEYVET
jgi:PAS domain S-box-containing protein